MTPRLNSFTTAPAVVPPKKLRDVWDILAGLRRRIDGGQAGVKPVASHRGYALCGEERTMHAAADLVRLSVRYPMPQGGHRTCW